MEILIKVVLPLALAFIMFSLGLGLTLADFKRVLVQPKAFFVGAFCQIILVPIVAYTIAVALALPPALAVGLMILSFCPGGVTSNLMSKLAGADVALSVSLTGVVSIASMFTVPFLVAWAVAHFMGADAPSVSITGLALAMFLITALPVVLGVALRHFKADFANRAEPALSKAAVILFVVIVIAALAGSWSTFVEQMGVIGISLVTLNAALIALALLVAKVMSLPVKEARTVAIETGVQNGTLGIALGTLIAAEATGFTPFSMPSAVYGITMYLVTLPFVFWARSRGAAA